MRKIVFVLTLILAPFSHAATPQQQLNALFDNDWQWSLRTAPEMATAVGDNRYNDRLSDVSPAASLAANAHQEQMLAQAARIDRSKLSGQDLLSYDLFIYEKKKNIQAAGFYPYNPSPLTQLSGVQFDFPQLVAQTPFNDAKDYRNYLARLRALPKYVDGVIAQLQQGVKSGWVAPKVTMSVVPGQLQEFVAKLDSSPLAAPFKDMPASIPAAQRMQLARQGQLLLQQDIAPAFRKLDAYVRNVYLPACRDSIAASSLPGGPAYYAFKVKENTTTSMTPQEIHQIGVQEVARIQAEMKLVMQQTGFTGTFAEFITFLNTDPRFYFTKREDLLAGYKDIIKKSSAQLPRFFADIPKAPVDVKAVPDVGAENQAGAYYEPGTPDGSRPGYFFANLSKLETRPKWEMETLTLHESIPGHHLQTARAQEIKGLPAFRRFGWYVAFGEGWALYAESLGGEMGFYTDPYSKFGHLNDELFRAARLVVDTGMHALGWSRQQAIDYMNVNTANPPHDNQVEIDRYIVDPGQALGYKIGQLKIKALREKAQAALGDKFDLRRFNNAVIDNGALPLEMLEAQIDSWIAQQAAVKS
ncbi:DUF885 domain-containing protein [Collimonas sp.]|jgi:uncharacterized protein (DUF885 family)|uniref:DUF885 domain-containing protein n=1 Tax=Collimonas sp. TaxID=1963772 RepID=UPI002B8EB497|nr:DUF885 domain-containing protein [Collimonas sp.]HWX01911.1 DUF885 domain-containing protein [Collimonas sp.]